MRRDAKGCEGKGKGSKFALEIPLAQRSPGVSRADLSL